MDLLTVIIVAILFSAYFSGMEIAFVSANKLRLELDKNQKALHSKLLSVFTQNPAQFIATMLIGSNIALVIYGIAFARLLEPSFRENFAQPVVLLLQVLSATFVILITAEYLPKMIIRINPNAVLKIFTLPTVFFYFLFYPIARITLGISKITLKIFLNESIGNVNEKIVFSRHDLDHFVGEPESSITANAEDLDNEVKLFRNALDFSKVKLREIMVPRNEMVVMDIHSTVDDLREKFIETGYSRILLYQDNIDNITGFIHHSVILNNPDSIKSKVRKVLIVPETMPANKLLSKFIQQRSSIAIVVDEFGGTAGMVTSEDILEEIFGEIEDEHDTISVVEKQVGENEFILSGRAELDELNAKFGFDFPEDENYETLAGFILSSHESIPKINTIISIGKYRFKILKASNIKIELVHLKILANT
jgi:CBS domain containing-hemolysin-like protein